MIGYGSNEWRRERNLSMLKAFPLHKLTLRQTVTLPPQCKSRIFESYLRSHPYSLVRDRRVTAGARGLDDPRWVLFPALGEFFLGRGANCNGSPWRPHCDRQQS